MFCCWIIGRRAQQFPLQYFNTEMLIFYYFLMLKVKFHIEINEYYSIYFSWAVQINSVLGSRLLFKAEQMINCSFPSGLRTNLYHLFPYIARITLYCFFSFGSGVVLRIMVVSVNLKALYMTKAYCIDIDEQYCIECAWFIMIKKTIFHLTQ